MSVYLYAFVPVYVRKCVNILYTGACENVSIIMCLSIRICIKLFASAYVSVFVHIECLCVNVSMCDVWANADV